MTRVSFVLKSTCVTATASQGPIFFYLKTGSHCVQPLLTNWPVPQYWYPCKHSRELHEYLIWNSFKCIVQSCYLPFLFTIIKTIIRTITLFFSFWNFSFFLQYLQMFLWLDRHSSSLNKELKVIESLIFPNWQPIQQKTTQPTMIE